MKNLKTIAAKVLIVEDDPDILNALNVALGSAGFDVDVLLNGKGILNNQFVRPDLFIIDKQLPDIDGLEICRFLHSKPNYRKIPVIVISGAQRIKTKALDAGATCFIAKPFAVIDLLRAINKSLRLAE
jgi:DNA-binding response OmpR family regulator